MSQGNANGYAYVKDNPVSNADPFGLQTVPGTTPGYDPPEGGGDIPDVGLCMKWRCSICDCNGKCVNFTVESPHKQPGQGGFFGPGGYAGDASKMKECVCTDAISIS